MANQLPIIDAIASGLHPGLSLVCSVMIGMCVCLAMKLRGRQSARLLPATVGGGTTTHLVDVSTKNHEASRCSPDLRSLATHASQMFRAAMRTVPTS